MTLFWILTAVMILAALALLAPTLLRRPKAAADTTRGFNVEIAREHLAELEKQRAAGDLSEEEFAQAKRDVELALAQDLETSPAIAGSTSSGGGWALAAAAILIPLIALPMYLHIGSPQLIGASAGSAETAGHGAGQLPPIGELVVQLRERMEANPDNAEGWYLLGRTYMRLQDYPQAVYAYQKVVNLAPEEPAALLSLADAMAMRDNRQIGPEARALLEKALTLDPTSVTALWLLGNAASEAGEKDKALDYWNRAYPLLAGEPQMQGELAQMITGAGGTLPPAATPAAASSAPVETTAPGNVAQGGAAITVEVALKPALMERVAPEDTVFVLARAENGPPMPLAVARLQAAELPLKVTLTDQMAMMPAMKLSSFPRVLVSAKISKSGQAGTQAGDLYASGQVVESANPPESVQLVIDQVAE